MKQQENKLLSGKKILLTGGTGFLGSRVLRLLAEAGADCWVISRTKRDSQVKNVTYVQMNLNTAGAADYKMLAEQSNGKFDALVYLAANIPEQGAPRENYLDAKVSTLDPIVGFFQHASLYAEKIVYASTIDIMGTTPKYQFTEIDMPNPVSPYALAKYSGELYTKYICQAANKPFIALRFSQIYGSFEPIVRVIPIALSAAKTNQVFNKYTTGEEKRAFIHVDDAARSVYTAILSSATGVYNIAGLGESSVNDLLRNIEETYNISFEYKIIADNRSSDIVPNISKASLELGFEPKISLADGVRKIFQEEKQHAK